MASATFDLNDLSVQAVTHVDRNGRTVLTVTDGTDVAILIGGERMRQAIRDALDVPVLKPGPDEVVMVATQLREGMRFQCLGSRRWHTVARIWPEDGFASVSVECNRGGDVYLDAAEQVLVQVPACPGSEMFAEADR